MSELVSPRWLTEGMDKYFADEPDLIDAYDMEPYSSEMSGEGDWMTLYKETGEPFAILWYSPETDSVGIELGHNCYDIDLLTVENLRMRLYKAKDMSASAAYQEVASRYNTSDEQPVDLGHLLRMYVKPVR